MTVSIQHCAFRCLVYVNLFSCTKNIDDLRSQNHCMCTYFKTLVVYQFEQEVTIGKAFMFQCLCAPRPYWT